MSRRPSIDERQAFAVELGHLVRTVTKHGGGTYSHRCSLESFKAVAHFIEEHAQQGISTNMLWQGLPNVPCTQASVAVAFLKDRGCIDVRHRRMFPTSGCFVEDALVEFHALQHAGRDFASEAQQAQAANAWPTAVALWRQVAEASGDAAERERCLKQAAWCDDMAALVEEPADQP
jgi:hypothetical protein